MLRIRTFAFLLFAALALSSCSKSEPSAAGSQPSASSAKASAAGSAAATAAAPAAATTATKAWYADRLEQLGFYVFPQPIKVDDFKVERLKGGVGSLSEARGKVVLLNFWATWCPPCRAEMPSIERLWKKLGAGNFTVLAVSVGETKDTVAKFIAENKYSYPIYLDPTGALGSAFNASSIPTTYIVDKGGNVIAGVQGSREYDTPEVLAFFEELAAK